MANFYALFKSKFGKFLYGNQGNVPMFDLKSHGETFAKTLLRVICTTNYKSESLKSGEKRELLKAVHY